MSNVYIDEEIAKALADIDDFNYDDNFVNQLGLEVIDTEKESGGRNGDLLSETFNGDGGNVELKSIVAERKWRVMVMRDVLRKLQKNQSESLPVHSEANVFPYPTVNPEKLKYCENLRNFLYENL